jgi:hypothetical protein
MAEKATPSSERAEKPTREPRAGARPSARSFISRIVSDPNTPPAVYLLCGYPGDSAKDGHTRFYVSLDLSVWVDVPDDAVIHVEEVGDRESELQPVMAWIRQDAQVLYGNRWFR